jgi:phosphoribosylglycinamide formyltransferase-1
VTEAPLNVAVFASGGGSNFQALLDHQNKPGVGWGVAVLICNREEAGAIERARAAGVEAVVIPTKGRDPTDVADDTLAVLEKHEIDLVCLAGYLRLLPPEVVRRYEGRILNIHPGLLPDFGGEGMYGMHVHRAVVESGVDVTGATVHVVDEAYDHGPTLARWHVSVRPHDSPEELAARVLRVEHELYPRAVDHVCAAIAEGREVERMRDMHLEEPPNGGGTFKRPRK